MRFLRSIFGRKDEETAPDRVMVSLVVLYDTYIELDLDALRRALDDVFPGEFLPPRAEGSFVIDGAVPGATFMIKSAVKGASGLFMLNNVPGPYTEFSDFADIVDPALRDRAEKQSCWLSIDLMHPTASVEDAYCFIGKLLARIAPDDTALLVHPETFRSMVFDEEVRDRLSKGELLFAVQ